MRNRRHTEPAPRPVTGPIRLPEPAYAVLDSETGSPLASARTYLRACRLADHVMHATHSPAHVVTL